jgi:hypothetical protein
MLMPLFDLPTCFKFVDVYQADLHQFVRLGVVIAHRCAACFVHAVPVGVPLSKRNKLKCVGHPIFQNNVTFNPSVHNLDASQVRRLKN